MAQTTFSAGGFSIHQCGHCFDGFNDRAFRLQSDVLAGGRVDLLIVEFAVNDDQDAAHARRECIRGMEGIVRHLRKVQSQADGLMVHYVNPEM